VKRSDLLCLLRTRTLQREWSGRRVTDREAVQFASGRETSAATWTRMVRAGLVRNTRAAPGIALTAAGEKKLRELGI